MHASLDVNTEEKLLEAVTLLRHAPGDHYRHWRIRPGGAKL
jgi:hypothetical protein